MCHQNSMVAPDHALRRGSSGAVILCFDGLSQLSFRNGDQHEAAVTLCVGSGCDPRRDGVVSYEALAQLRSKGRRGVRNSRASPLDDLPGSALGQHGSDRPPEGSPSQDSMELLASQGTVLPVHYYE